MPPAQSLSATSGAAIIQTEDGRLYRRHAGGCYYFDVHIGRRRVRKSTGTANPLEAARTMQRMRALGIRDCPIQPTIGDLHRRIGDNDSAQRMHQKTVAAYQAKLTLFKGYLATCGWTDLPLQRLNADHIVGYVRWRSSTPVSRNGAPYGRLHIPSPRTVNNDLDGLRACFRRAIEWGWMEQEPTAGVRRDRKAATKARVRSLRREAVIGLLDAAKSFSADPRRSRARACFHPFIETILGCGLRREEARMLQRSDIDWENNSIHVQAKQVQGIQLIECHETRWRATRRLLDAGAMPPWRRIPRGTTIEELMEAEWLPEHKVLVLPRCWRFQTKADNADRQVPIPPRLVDALRIWHGRHLSDWYEHNHLVTLRDELGLPDPGFLFPHDDGGPYRASVNVIMAHVAGEAGLPTPRIHDLRHTYATWLRQQGVELATIQRLLGHRDIKTTLMYADYTLSEGHRAVAGLSW